MTATMDEKAMKLVSDYAFKHMDESDKREKKIPDFEVFIVWKCKTLQNWKFMISTTLIDGMYYEVTFNGDKHEWYIDAYKKFDNQCFRDW